MREVVKFITEKLSKHRIRMDVGSRIEELVVSNKVNEFMTPSSIYTVFLLGLAKDDEMYRRLLNGTYLFDLEVEIQDRRGTYECEGLRRAVVDIYKDRAQYVYVSREDRSHFVGIRLSSRGYAPVMNYNGPEDTIPYFLLVEELRKDFRIWDFGWNEVIFGFVGEDEYSKYVEVLEHVKGIKLPVPIIDDDAIHVETSATNVHTCYLHCGSHENWPEDEDALSCAKTALYCLIYKKSRYRCSVGYGHVLLKYRGSYFKFQIVIRRDKRARFRIDCRIAEAVSQQSDMFKKNVVSVKRFLGSHGYFPVYFDDQIVELICLMFGRNHLSFGRFFNDFLEHRIELEGCTFNLETFKLSENKSGRLEVVYQHDLLCVSTPPKKVVQRLNRLKRVAREWKPILFDEEFRLQTYRLLQPSLKDYDFVLSSSFRPGSVEIKGRIPSPFPLGKPLVEEALAPSLRNKGYFFYSPGNSMLMAKTKDGVDAEELLCVLILKTSFKYCIKNF